MQDLSIDIKMMPQAFRGYHLSLVITCDQTNFMIAVPHRDRTGQTVAEALMYRVIYLFRPPRQIICDEATEFSSAIIQAILCMLNCRLKVISPYNNGSSKCDARFFCLFLLWVCINILRNFGECCKSVPLDRPGSYVSISINIYIIIILARVVQVDAFLL